ncbi:MAG: type II toxin-antitoxin system VapB family antitoxin [Propionibacteriaceae bacterium]|jgi:antitoxin VapB|nr:type II toxin-antitoxin system VapB family antitoxin [Propionibacteriaceae bacterium]
MAATATRPITVSIFMNRSNQAVRIPKELSFHGVEELEMRRVGDVITLRPVKPDWASFFDLPPADDDFLAERPDVVEFRPADFGDVDGDA